LLVSITDKGRNHIRDLRNREGNFVAGVSPDFDILLYLYDESPYDPMNDFKIGMDLKILREDLNDAINRLIDNKYVKFVKHFNFGKEVFNIRLGNMRKN